MINEFKFEGEIFYLKELDDEFDFRWSLKLRGSSKRNLNSPPQIAEISFLMSDSVYRQVHINGLVQYSKVILKGHMETWRVEKRSSIKTMFIADDVEVIKP